MNNEQRFKGVSQEPVARWFGWEGCKNSCGGEKEDFIEVKRLPGGMTRLWEDVLVYLHNCSTAALAYPDHRDDGNRTPTSIISCQLVQGGVKPWF